MLRAGPIRRQARPPSTVCSSNHVWFGISLAPIVIGVALLERLKAPAPLGWLLMLGNASYAVYLVHNPIVSVVARLSMGLHSWELSLMLCMIAGIVFGVAYHFLVEKPGIRMTTKLERYIQNGLNLLVNSKIG